MTESDAFGREIRLQPQADGSYATRTRRDEAVCDFCTLPNPTWTHPCGHVRILGHELITDSKDPWAACDECHALIEASDANGLIARAWRIQNTRPIRPDFKRPADRPFAMLALAKNVLAFMRAREGPGYKAEPAP